MKDDKEGKKGSTKHGEEVPAPLSGDTGTSPPSKEEEKGVVLDMSVVDPQTEAFLGSKLPVDVLVLLFQYLDLRSMIAALSTCKKLYLLSNHARLWNGLVDQLPVPEARKVKARETGALKELMIASYMWLDPIEFQRRCSPSHHENNKKKLFDRSKKSSTLWSPPCVIPLPSGSPYIFKARGDDCFMGTFSDDMYIFSAQSKTQVACFHVSTNSSSNYRLDLDNMLLLSKDGGVKLIDVNACQASSDKSRSPLKGVLHSFAQKQYPTFDFLGCKERAFGCQVHPDGLEVDILDLEVGKVVTGKKWVREPEPAPVKAEKAYASSESSSSESSPRSRTPYLNWESCSSSGLATHTGVVIDPCCGDALQWIDPRADDLAGTRITMDTKASQRGVYSSGAMALVTTGKRRSPPPHESFPSRSHLFFIGTGYLFFDKRMGALLHRIELPTPAYYGPKPFIDEAKCVWFSEGEDTSCINMLPFGSLTTQVLVSHVGETSPGGAKAKVSQMAVGDSNIFLQCELAEPFPRSVQIL